MRYVALSVTDAFKVELLAAAYFNLNAAVQTSRAALNTSQTTNVGRQSSAGRC